LCLSDYLVIYFATIINYIQTWNNTINGRH
jgi:hypothetical protein